MNRWKFENILGHHSVYPNLDYGWERKFEILVGRGRVLIFWTQAGYFSGRDGIFPD